MAQKVSNNERTEILMLNPSDFYKLKIVQLLVEDLEEVEERIDAYENYLRFLVKNLGGEVVAQMSDPAKRYTKDLAGHMNATPDLINIQDILDSA